MKPSDFTIRRMNLEDLKLACEWAAKEGWNPGLHDAECFFAADPQGYFIAEMNGKPVGTVSSVAYDDNFGFLGFYIVNQELRHLGIGMKLCDTAFEYLGSRTMGADGVTAMLGKYASIGLKLANYNARYEGIGAASDLQLTSLSHVPFQELERYDRRFFPAPRSAFLECWISRPGTHPLAVMDGAAIKGYGVIRLCHRGFKIAPLFADTPEIAEQLFTALSACAAGQPIFLDIPCCNQEAQALVARHGMTKVFETGRIYKGTPPELPLEQIYGITSFELG